MHTISEFRDAASAHRRRMVIAATVSVIGMFACFGLAALCRQFLGAFRWGLVEAEDLILAFPVLAILVFLGGMWTGYRRGRRDPRLLCPHCGALLAQHRDVVVASRNCCECGHRVLAEPE